MSATQLKQFERISRELEAALLLLKALSDSHTALSDSHTKHEERLKALEQHGKQRRSPRRD